MPGVAIPNRNAPYDFMHNKVFLGFTEDKVMEFKDSFYLLTKFLDKHLALPLDNILGVFKLEDITPIPNNKNKYLLGVTNAKGHVVPVLDFNLGKKLDSSNLLVVFETKWGKRAGVFEKIEEVMLFSKEDLERTKIDSESDQYHHLVINSKEFILLEPELNLNISNLVEDLNSKTSKAS